MVFVFIVRGGPDIFHVAAAPALARGAGAQGARLQLIAVADGLGRVPGQIVAPRRRPDRVRAHAIARRLSRIGRETGVRAVVGIGVIEDGPHMVGDVANVAQLILLPPPGPDHPRLALAPVSLVAHLASSCLWRGGWRMGASGSDGGAPTCRD
ncbi:hypothetical protein D3C85_779990 [compost metagenome]